jgi:hypothetical protein
LEKQNRDPALDRRFEFCSAVDGLLSITHFSQPIMRRGEESGSAPGWG